MRVLMRTFSFDILSVLVQIANRFITKKELDSAYFCVGEINEHKVIAVIMLSSYNHNEIARCKNILASIHNNSCHNKFSINEKKNRKYLALPFFIGGLEFYPNFHNSFFKVESNDLDQQIQICET